MLTFIVEDTKKRYENLFPLLQNGYPLTESSWLLRWFDRYSIEYNIVPVCDATPDSWYCVGVNFWSFDYDYLQVLSDPVKEKLSKNSMRILFIYRESDDPRRIRQHIVDMSLKHGVDPELIWLICGNSRADLVPNSRFFWYFDCDYFFQTQQSRLPQINKGPRDRNITCLTRIHKHWREWFVYNLCRIASPQKNYVSYGAVTNTNLQDFELWYHIDAKDSHCINGYAIDILPPDDIWHNSLPLCADELNTFQHNRHSIVVEEHFQNSYWNIVLETLLDTNFPGGVFITEKTLKPIRNGQSFVILGCQNSLEFLRDHGYQTFNHVIDESYDTISSLHERWYRVFEIAQKLSIASQDYLNRMHYSCLPVITHNQKHFMRSRKNELISLAEYLDAI